MTHNTNNQALEHARHRHGYSLVWLIASFFILVLSLYFMIGPSGGVDAAPRWQQLVLGCICLSFGWSIIDVITTGIAFNRKQLNQNG